MATTIANLQAVLSVDPSGLTSGLKDAQEKTKSFGSSLKDIGKQAAGFALAQIGVSSLTDVLGIAKDTLGGWIQGAEDAQVAQAHLNQILDSGQHIVGLTAGAVAKLNEQLSSQDGMDDDDVQAAENVFAAYSGLSKDAFPGATQASLQMARAFQMAHGGALDAAGAATALQGAMMKPQRAMQTLKQYGVDLTAQDQAQINTWAKKGDAADIQAFLMQKVGDSTKGAVDAYNNTAQGKIEAFHTTMDNMGKNLASLVLPAISKLADVGKGVLDFFQQGSPLAKTIAGIIGGVLVVAVTAYAVSMASAAVATIAATWPILAIVAAVAALAAGFVWAYNNIGPFHAAVDLVGNSIKLAAGTIANLVGWLVSHLQPALGTIGDFIHGPLNVAWQGMQHDIQMVMTWIGNFIGKLGDLLGKLGAVKDAIGGALGGAGNLLGHIPGFAGGTSDAPGGFAMVGESGPELMYVPQHAQISPHGSSPAMASGGYGGGYGGGSSTTTHTTVVIQLDAREIARATVPHIPGVVRARTGLRV